MAQKRRSVKAELVEQLGDGTYKTRNTELERKILKQVFSRPDQIGIISSSLMAGHFTDPRYRDIYLKSVEIYKQGRMRKSDSSVVLAECLRKPSDELEPEDYKAAIDEVFLERDEVDVEQAILTLNSLMLARKLQAFSHEVIAKASSGEDVNSLITEASSYIRTISADSMMSDNFYDLDRLISEQKDGVSSLIEPEDNGIRTPFPLLNDMISGFCPGDLYVVGGRPGTGKTALMGMFGYYAAALLNFTLFYAHEMSKESMWTRLMCCHCGVTNQDVRHLELTTNEKEICRKWFNENPARKHLKFIDRGGKTPMQVRSDIIRHKDKHGSVGLLLIDYLQQMRSGLGHKDKREEVSYLSSSLKDIAVEFNLPVVVSSAMNRAFEHRQGKDKRPELADLNESGQIESDASVVIFPHRPSMTQVASANAAPADDELIVRKNRHGPTGVALVRYNGPYFRFENLPEKRV